MVDLTRTAARRNSRSNSIAQDGLRSFTLSISRSDELGRLEKFTVDYEALISRAIAADAEAGDERSGEFDDGSHSDDQT